MPSLPSGRGHWTRDVAFSADGGTMFVSVGSGSNDAEEMPDAPPEGSPPSPPSMTLGAAWGAEENRADVLAFDPDGGGRRVFATGIRNARPDRPAAERARSGARSTSATCSATTCRPTM